MKLSLHVQAFVQLWNPNQMNSADCSIQYVFLRSGFFAIAIKIVFLRYPFLQVGNFICFIVVVLVSQFVVSEYFSHNVPWLGAIFRDDLDRVFLRCLQELQSLQHDGKWKRLQTWNSTVARKRSHRDTHLDLPYQERQSFLESLRQVNCIQHLDLFRQWCFDNWRAQIRQMFTGDTLQHSLQTQTCIHEKQENQKQRS